MTSVAILQADGSIHTSCGWIQGETYQDTLQIEVAGDDLKAVEQKLKEYGAGVKKVGSTAKSIDWGGPFFVTISHVHKDHHEELKFF